MVALNAKQVIEESGVKFGTSGARGLVSQFSPEVCAAFTHAFLETVSGRFHFKQVAVAMDNRPSSYAMVKACIAAIESLGLEAVFYGVIPTPALAYTAMQDSIPGLMVTGSHIPFDRNGLKFYRPDGEITKVDEESILTAEVGFESELSLSEPATNYKAAQLYIERYTQLFDASSLKGKRIGIYEHSSAGRDLYQSLFENLGAEIVSLERTDEFVPIDTEAVSEADKLKARTWSEELGLDLIFSTDGDGDRPLLADENGEWLRGDILGLLCAEAMNVDAVAVPISCNTIISTIGVFENVSKTKIGSPYVIAEFEPLLTKYKTVAGFEANGGFLLGSDVMINGKCLKALPTRDAVLPVLMLLVKSQKTKVCDMVSALPKRFTHSDRIQDFALEKSELVISEAIRQPNDFFKSLGFNETFVLNIDQTDGLRMTLDSGDVVHLRPSGNAPELRCYVESDSVEKATLTVVKILEKLRAI